MIICRFKHFLMRKSLQGREAQTSEKKLKDALDSHAGTVLRLMRLSLASPHYSTLCRRARGLELSLAAPSKIKHMVIDSTGLKVYGKGEWVVGR
jgi:hypothetical protein